MMKAGIILLLAASPMLAGSQAVAADLRFGKAEPIAPVAAAMDSREKPVHARARSKDAASDERSPLAYGAFALIGEASDENFPESNHTVHLYPVVGDAQARAAAAATQASAAKENGDGESARRVKKASLPEPGSWAMILAGLLGVGAIARRRMSA